MSFNNLYFMEPLPIKESPLIEHYKKHKKIAKYLLIVTYLLDWARSIYGFSRSDKIIKDMFTYYETATFKEIMIIFYLFSIIEIIIL